MKIRTYKVCIQCIQDLKDMRYFSENGTQKLPATKNYPIIKPNCPQKPTCFDQPKVCRQQFYEDMATKMMLQLTSTLVPCSEKEKEVKHTQPLGEIPWDKEDETD